MDIKTNVLMPEYFHLAHFVKARVTSMPDSCLTHAFFAFA